MSDIDCTGIYAIVNILSGKVYVGSTMQSFKRRWSIHKSKLNHNRHGNSHLQRAWNKYGAKAFLWMILEIVQHAEKIIQREQYWLDEHLLFCDLYNTGRVASNPFLGCKHTEETRKRISEASRKKIPRRGWHHTEGTKKKLRQIQSGRHHTEAAKSKMSKFQTGREKSEEHKRKIGRALIGIKRSEAHCRRNGEIHAREYPAFYHQRTGEIIPPGRNLSALARQRGLHAGAMGEVANGKRTHHRDWVLA